MKLRYYNLQNSTTNPRIVSRRATSGTPSSDSQVLVTNSAGFATRLFLKQILFNYSFV